MVEKLEIQTIKWAGLKDEFYLEYVKNGHVRRVYFPYDAVETLENKFREFLNSDEYRDATAE